MKAGADNGSNQTTNPCGVHDLSSIAPGSSKTNDKEAGMEDDRYGP